jgi:quercetin dioxygenase-like cupin family protein
MNVPLECLPRVDKSWGYEELIYNEEYCTKLLVYTKRIASSRHYHQNKKETFIVTSGKFVIEIGEPNHPVMSSELYTPGDSITIPPGIVHRVRCIEPGVIVECSTHDDPDDCVRLIPSEK